MKNNVFACALLVVIAFVNLIAWHWGIGMESFMFYLPMFAIIISIICIFPKIRNGHIEFKILYLFVAGILYFNIPWYLMSLFDDDFVYLLSSLFRVSVESFKKSCLLLGMSFPMIIAGYIMFQPHRKKSAKQYRRRYIPLKPFVVCCWIMLLLSFLVTGWKVGGLYMGASSYFYVMLVRFTIFTTCVVIYNSYFALNRSVCQLLKVYWFYFVYLLLFALYLLVGGDRGPVLVVVLILLWGWFLNNSMQVKFKYMIVLVLGVSSLVYVFSMVEHLRLSDENLASSLSMLGEAENGISIVSSERCTCLAIEGIDNKLYPHTYGLLTFQQIISSIPFWGNKLLSIIDLPSMFIGGSAMMLSVQHYGANPVSGLGTTYLADLYIEFGVLGVLLFSFLLGITIKYVEYMSCNPQKWNIYSFSLMAFFVGYSIYTGRATWITFLANYIHAMFFAVIGLLVIRLLLTRQIRFV